MSVRDEDDRAIFWDDPILLMDDENLDNPPVELTHRSVQASSISNRDSAIESNFMSEKETAARSIPAYSPSQLSSSLSLISRTDQIASNTDRIGSFTSKPAFVTSISMPADDGFRSRTSDMTSPLISNSPKRSMFVKKTLKTNSIPVYKGAAILERRSASTQNVVMEEHIPLMLGSGNLPRELSGTSLSDSIMNSINILVGVGILISPYAISQTGWMGLGIMSLLCVLSCYSAILIGKCMDAKPGILTLIDLGKEAFGSGAEMIISLLIFLELFGALSIYIVLQVDSLEYALPNTLPRISWTVIVGCIILLTIWIGNLSDLSFLSIFGCFVNITVLFVALIYSGIITQVSPGSIANPSSTSYGIFDGIPLCVSFLMFGFSGHTVFPNVYDGMRDRRQYPFVMKSTYFFVFLLYAGIASLGYLMYGANTNDEIILNLDRKLYPTKIILWLTIVVPFTKAALIINPVCLIVEAMLLSPRLQGFQRSFWRICIRTIIVSLSALVAALIVDYYRLMGLIGASCSLLIGIAAPCLFFIKIHQQTLSKSAVSLNFIIVLLAVTLSISGSIFSFL